METSPVTWLLVDDDELDLEHVRRTMKRDKLEFSTAEARSGERALEWLRGDGRARPTVVVLLDLRMPRMTGHEFLVELREDDELRRTPVFVMSTSRDRVDIARSYDLGAAGYFVKGDNDVMSAHLGFIARFCRLSSLPTRRDTAEMPALRILPSGEPSDRA